MLHPDEEVRIRNRSRMIGDPDLRLLLQEIDRLRLQVQAENNLNVALTGKLVHLPADKSNA